jgi:hypothetical protein
VRQPNNVRSHEYRLELSEEMLARDGRWEEQQSEPWKDRYRIRSGVEATMSELKRGHGMGRLRVRRHARVLVQVALKATACNIKRWIRAVLAALCGLLAAVYAVCRRLGVSSSCLTDKFHVREKFPDGEIASAAFASAS